LDATENVKIGVTYMTDTQKQTVLEMRRQGSPHADIAGAVGLRESAIKSYCWRHNIKPGQPIPQKPNGYHCQNCGQRIVQEPKKKPKKFCNEKCRSNWWNHNRRYFNSRLRISECAYCNKRFEKIGNSVQRFCSHTCYINSRFGEVLQK